MDLSKDPGLPKLLQGWRSIDDHIVSLMKKPALNFPYQDGACLTISDVETMKISFDPIAETGFWIPAGDHVRSKVKQALTIFSGIRDRRAFFKEELARKDRQTIKIAYCASSEYIDGLDSKIAHCLFRMRDASGKNLYQLLWSQMPVYLVMENRLVFRSPGYPHVTILTIQPQRASSQKELLYTEFWTLYYWARKLAARGRDTTQRSLPMRLVSICGFEARIVSAVFSYQYPRCVASKEVGCQVHIAEYRDLSDMNNIHELLMELAATPCGNKNLLPEPPEEDN